MFVLSACSSGSNTSSNPDPIVNTAPVVNAGTDATIRLPANAALDGTVSDDGQPAGAAVSTAWSVSSGPAGATIADVNAVDTTVTFVSEGTYVLMLTADDTDLQGCRWRYNRSPLPAVRSSTRTHGSAVSRNFFRTLYSVTL